MAKVPRDYEEDFAGDRWDEPGMLGSLPNGKLLIVNEHDPIPIMKGDEKEFAEEEPEGDDEVD